MLRSGMTFEEPSPIATASGLPSVRAAAFMASARLYPIGLLAELTHRCPLGCPYCSNPVALERRESELDAPTWRRAFQEASALGVLQVHLSGGEPAARTDL